MIHLLKRNNDALKSTDLIDGKTTPAVVISLFIIVAIIYFFFFAFGVCYLQMLGDDFNAVRIPKVLRVCPTTIIGLCLNSV